ncbi:2,5-didehydrogluconate reductase [Ligilactobacillus pobuzihii E100301 = KCTC 13174]|uniref:2,5-didehydrogluconate reductase n=2 Tax=Ligilactobacillus pobuzihii TaxID=449659 RepID=A0A0R2LL52_9LACO|nr:aldo/keto reductase [Ligilactobacillus pobuzihii]KRK10240.1 2,5-didehydrogluconate reductase [Ligilactobacillus pobuzihii E100301 = KCTC 13174]KRO02087.1 2,5-didehydrogluconate reductase [Ligilactobacillus pobuzihii]
MIELNNGVQIPSLGFGVFQITDLKECEESVLTALKTGYRLIDTAAGYENESAVGNAIKKSGLARKDIFISSKVWITHDGYQETMNSFEQTLEKLQTDYLDLYLVHMPYGDYHGSWRAMEELYKAGKIKAIGVCNFLEDRLTDLILTHEIVPAINQMETHPFNQQKELQQVMNKNNIKLMAWGPFAEGQNNIFTNEVLVEIGKKYDKTAAQVILRWLREEDIIAIPKSVHLNRIKENFAIDDFSLSLADKEKISQLDQAKPLILNITALNEVYRLHGLS